MYSPTYFAVVALFGVFALWLATRIKRSGQKRTVRGLLSLVVVFALAIAGNLSDWPFGTPRDPQTPSSGEITEPAMASDGDSLRIGRLRIRLVDIDAPELHQCCRDAGGHLNKCGEISRDHLRGLIANRDVSCTWREVDQNDRALATCHAGDINLNARMVEDGEAIPYHRRHGANSWQASPRYHSEQARASSARRGLHGYADFEPPHILRANERQHQKPRISGC